MVLLIPALVALCSISLPLCSAAPTPTPAEDTGASAPAPSIIVANNDPAVIYNPPLADCTEEDGCPSPWWTMNETLGDGSGSTSIVMTSGPLSSSSSSDVSFSYTFTGGAIEIHVLQDSTGSVASIHIDGAGYLSDTSGKNTQNVPYIVANLTGLDASKEHTLNVAWQASPGSGGRKEFLFFDHLVVYTGKTQTQPGGKPLFITGSYPPSPGSGGTNVKNNGVGKTKVSVPLIIGVVIGVTVVLILLWIVKVHWNSKRKSMESVLGGIGTSGGPGGPGAGGARNLKGTPDLDLTSSLPKSLGGNSGGGDGKSLRDPDEIELPEMGFRMEVTPPSRTVSLALEPAPATEPTSTPKLGNGIEQEHKREPGSLALAGRISPPLPPLPEKVHIKAPRTSLENGSRNEKPRRSKTRSNSEKQPPISFNIDEKSPSLYSPSRRDPPSLPPLKRLPTLRLSIPRLSRFPSYRGWSPGTTRSKSPSSDGHGDMNLGLSPSSYNSVAGAFIDVATTMALGKPMGNLKPRLTMLPPSVPPPPYEYDLVYTLR